MIGTRRTTVNAILGTMERKGLLRHQRGRITISDHKHLEKAACDCYPLLRRSLDRLYKAGRHCVQIASLRSSTQVTGRAIARRAMAKRRHLLLFCTGEHFLVISQP